jgi:hypothetical protein
MLTETGASQDAAGGKVAGHVDRGSCHVQQPVDTQNEGKAR